jgi:hypothetical protein
MNYYPKEHKQVRCSSIRKSLIAAIAVAATVALASSTFGFSNGDRITVTSSNGVNVRQTPGGTYVGGQVQGATGTITGGPSSAQVGGTGTYYTWYNVDFDNSSVDGWVVQDGIGPATTTAPDLTVSSSVTASPNPATAGNSVAINFTIANLTSGNANASTTKIQIKNSSNTLLVENNFSTPAISGNGSYAASYSLTLPSSASGTCTAYVILDNFNTAGQTNYSNDNASGSFTVNAAATAPDLTVSGSVTANPNPVTAGNSVAINFTIANITSRSANASTTKIQIKNSSGTLLVENNFSTPAISGNASYSASYSLTLPSNASGTCTAYVILDNFNSAGQTNYSNDNANGSFTVNAAATAPDLTVSGSVTANPNPATAGNSVAINFTISNVTSGNANASTTKIQIKNSSGTLLVENNFSTPSISGNSSYSAGYSLTLPSNASGTCTAYVILDNFNQAGQTNYSNDNASGSFNVNGAATAADLTVSSSVTASPNPATAGNSVAINFTIANLTSGNANASTTKIQIKNSSNTLLVENNFSTPAISGNASYSASYSLTLPSNASGTCTAYVILDNFNTAGQTNYSNDNASGSFSVNGVATAPDLTVQGSVTANPNPATAGNSVMINFTISNLTSGNANASTTKVQIKNASNTLLVENNFSTPAISGNASYSASYSLTLPSNASGTCTAYIILDNFNSAGQTNYSNDNASGSFTVNGTQTGLTPSISGINPNPVTGSNGPITFSVNGANFLSGAKVQVAYASNGYTFVNTNTNATFVSAVQLTVPITTSTTADTWKVRVQNPDGLISGQVNLVVNAPASGPAPMLSSISPNPITGSNSPITFTVTGSNFVAGAKVRVAYASNNYTFVNTNTNATFVSSTQLTVPITTSTTADTWKVRVQNPDNQLSGEINLVVNAPGSNPAPVLSSVNPNSITGSTSPRTFTVLGSNFVNGAAVQVAFRDNNYQFQNTNTAPTFVDASQLTVPITTGTTVDTWRLRVRNPNGQLSNELNLMVVPPTPTSAPSISTFPNPSGNIYTSVNSFVANQGPNFSPTSVQTYLTGTAQAVDPLRPSRLKTVFATASGALKGIGTAASYASLFGTSPPGTTDVLGALLPFLNLSDRNELIADTTLFSADAAAYLATGNYPLALVTFDLFWWTTVIPRQLDQFVADDPIDPNYQEVVIPDSVSPPSLPSTGNAQVDSLVLDAYMKKVGAACFLKAAITTYNRYSTAYSASDATSAGLQLQALLNFLHLYDQAMQAAAEDMKQLKLLLPQAGFGDRSADPSAIQSMQQTLDANGVPQDIAQFLSDHGFTADQIEAARKQFLGVDPNAVSGTLFGGITDISVTAFHGTSQTPGESGNISTRGMVGTGDNVMIGGFIINGPVSKKVIIRAIGPDLTQYGLSGVLADPMVELHNSTGQLIAINNNWKDSQQSEIQASGLPPGNDLESAIVMTLNPGAYTAIVRGVNDTTGVALVEIYDLNNGVGSRLANISTRGFVQTGDNVMIGGTIVIGNTPAKVIVRAIGPTLTQYGVPNVLADPTLELHDGNGALMSFNDNWKDSQQAEIQATGLPPPNDAESAILATLSPGNYTAIVRGKNNTTGNALVEAYQLGN